MSLFQCFLASLLGGSNVLIAEPQEKNSNFGTYTPDAPLNFSSFMDLDYFNEQSRKIGYPEMIALDVFTKHSPRLAVYVYIKPRGRGTVQRLVWAAERSKCLESKDTQNMSEEFRTKYEKVIKWNDEFARKCIVRVVELWANYLRYWDGELTTIESMNTLIFGDWSPFEVTLVFSHWAFYLYAPLDVPPGTIDCIAANRDAQIKAQFRPSKRLLNDASMYQDMFLGGENKLAIMLRVERVIRSAERSEALSAVKRCFGEVSELKTGLAGDSSPLVTLDVGGKYGTNSFRSGGLKDVVDFTRRALGSLYNNKWTVTEWEESFVRAAGGVTDGGYIAALQRVLASTADCLVLMGGGDFQALAVQDFMKYRGSSNCIHQVCINYDTIRRTIDNFNKN